MPNIQQSIIELETRLSFQEQTIEQLNDVIIEQQKTLEKLHRQLQKLDKKIDDESQNWQHSHNLADEKPPHY